MLTLTGINPDLVDAELMRCVQSQRSGVMLAQLVRRLRRAGAHASADANHACAAEQFRSARQLFRSWRTAMERNVG